MDKEQKKAPQAIERVKVATKMSQDEITKWEAIAAVRTIPGPPDPHGIDLSVDPEKLLPQVEDFRNQVQADLNQQIKAGGVEVVAGPRIPPAPTDPQRILSTFFHYPQLPFPAVIFDLGQVTVRGTYKQITDNMKAWSFMPHYLAVADGLRLQGTSPKLTGTYAVSIVGFITVPHDRPVFPPVPPGGRAVNLNPNAAAAIGKEGAATSAAIGGPAASARGNTLKSPQGQPTVPTAPGQSKPAGPNTANPAGAKPAGQQPAVGTAKPPVGGNRNTVNSQPKGGVVGNQKPAAGVAKSSVGTPKTNPAGTAQVKKPAAGGNAGAKPGMPKGRGGQ